MLKLILPLLLFLSVGAWSQQTGYTVYAVRFAAVGSFPLADWVDNGPKTDSFNFDFMVWLIKGNGRNILVDAGFRPDVENAIEFKPYTYIQPDSALLQLGVHPEEITDIIISHPHWDHLDGIAFFPKAQIWIQKDDYRYFVGDAWQKGGDAAGFHPRDVRMLVEYNTAGRLTLVDGEKEIMPGIKVFTGARHTYNSQYVQVQSGANRIILASDNLWTYYSLEQLLPASKGGTFDPKAQVAAFKRMKTLASDPKFIIPGHDRKVFDRFPKIADGIVKIE